jgi:CBS domain-containing protein
MKVYEVMTQDIQTVSPATLVFEAAKLMEEAKVGFLPVVVGPHVIGVLTDRDLATRVVGHGLSSTRTRVGKVMTADPVFVYDDQPLEEAIRIMCSKRISRLLVHNRRERFVGVLSVADIATLAEPGQAESISEALGEAHWQSHMFATVLPAELSSPCLN